VKLATKAFGLINIDEKQKLFFPQGILGFENNNDYALLDSEQEPFFWLQSMDEEQIAFVVINPFLFRPDYELDISNEEMSEIGIMSPEQALIFTIVTIPADGSPITANLQGPLIICKETCIGRQVVLADARWKTKHDILAEMGAVRN
jgi:flagellar assembly factor FliW